jgi:hypothetical protein
MRKTLILALVLCVAASLAYAQTGSGSMGSGASSGTGSTGTSSTGTATSGVKGSKHPKGGSAAKTAKGDIASVDDANKSFVLHPKTGSDWTFKTNEKTSYWVGSKKGSWSDVKAGVDATVTYKNDGTDNWAIRVKLGKKS